MKTVIMAFIATRGNPVSKPGLTVLQADMERLSLLTKLVICVDLSSEVMYDESEFMPDFGLAESLLSKLGLSTITHWARSDSQWVAEVIPADEEIKP